MPSPAEYQILICVLAAVFLSLPVAMLVRARFRKADRMEAEFAGPPVALEGAPAAVAPPPLPPWPANAGPPVSETPWNPPYTDLLPPVPPPQPQQQGWTRKDAWFAFILAVVVALLMGPVAAGGGKADGADKIDFSATLFTVQIIFQAGVIGMVLGYLCLHRRFNPVALFGLRQMSVLRTIGVALLTLIAAYIGIMIVAAVTMPLLQDLTGIELKQQILVESAPQIKDPAARVLMFVTLCIGAPLMEELIFRGVLFSVAAKFIHPIYANVATSVLFGCIHNNLFSLIPLTLLGMVFAGVYQRTRSLAVPVLMHSLFNCSQFLLLLYGPKLQ